MSIEQLAKVGLAMQIAAMNRWLSTKTVFLEEARWKRISCYREDKSWTSRRLLRRFERKPASTLLTLTKKTMESNMPGGWIAEDGKGKRNHCYSFWKSCTLAGQMIQNIAKGRLGKFPSKKFAWLNQGEDIMDGKKTVREVLKRSWPEIRNCWFQVSVSLYVLNNLRTG